MRRINYTISEQDYLAGSRLFARRAYLRPAALITLAGTWLLYVVFAIAVSGGGWRNLSVSVAIATAVVIAVAAGIVGLNALILPRRVRKLHRQHRQLQLPQQAEWDDGVIRFTNSQGDVRIPWGDFAKWDQNPAVLMLYANDQLFYPIPRRALPDEARADMAAALAAHGVPFAVRRRPAP